jgi:hypothetical protein
MNPKILAGIGAAAVVGAALLVGLWPGAGKCRVCVVVLDVDGTKTQADWELCGDAPKADVEYPGLVRVVGCGDPYPDDGKPPPVVVAPEAKAAPFKDGDMAASIVKVEVVPGTSYLSPGASGAACADQRKDALLCERLIPAYPGSPARWERAPAALVLPPGQWRGKGCIASIPYETEVREQTGGPGSQIRKECLAAP